MKVSRMKSNNTTSNNAFQIDLQRAVELNAKLVPHVLQVIDWHFRSFFDTPSAEDAGDDLDTVFRICYDQLVSSSDDQHMEIQLKDNLGKLIQFVANCLAVFDRAPSGYDTREMNRLMSFCVDRMVANRLPLEEIVSKIITFKFQ